MRYADHGEVRRQPSTEVRRLLVDGDPRERIWAAWTLGVRDPNAHRELAERACVDPTPGVRRHLAVMMAGFRQADALWTLAHDSDPRVRATALHWLTRLARPHDLSTWDRIMPRYGHDVPIVRAAIIDGLPVDLPPTVDDAWPAALTDPALEVRQAAVNRIQAVGPAQDRCADQLRDVLAIEPNRGLRAQIRRLLKVPPPPAPKPARLYPLMRLTD